MAPLENDQRKQLMGLGIVLFITLVAILIPFFKAILYGNVTEMINNAGEYLTLIMAIASFYIAMVSLFIARNSLDITERSLKLTENTIKINAIERKISDIQKSLDYFYYLFMEYLIELDAHKDRFEDLSKLSRYKYLASSDTRESFEKYIF